MASRIIITQKGRTLQRELSSDPHNRNKVEFTAIASASTGFYSNNLPPSSPEWARSTKLSSTSQQFTSNVRPRGGYFGPKKPTHQVDDSLSQYKPPYYPNYLRRSPDEYPSAHFHILTPENTLKHARSVSSTITTKDKFYKPKQAPIDPSVLTNKELPIRYVHHTVFPYTLPDRPSFTHSLTPAQSQSLFYSSNKSSNNLETLPRSGLMNVDIFEDFPETSSPKQTRLEEFRRTMYSDNAMVTDHFSKRVVGKYDERKLNRMKEKHITMQKEFQGLLNTIEDKYQRKQAKVDENMNEAPEFLAEFKKKNTALESMTEMKNNANKRYLQRLHVVHEKKYKDTWEKFGVKCNKLDSQSQDLQVWRRRATFDSNQLQAHGLDGSNIRAQSPSSAGSNQRRVINTNYFKKDPGVLDAAAHMLNINT